MRRQIEGDAFQFDEWPLQFSENPCPTLRVLAERREDYGEFTRGCLASALGRLSDARKALSQGDLENARNSFNWACGDIRNATSSAPNAKKERIRAVYSTVLMLQGRVEAWIRQTVIHQEVWDAFLKKIDDLTSVDHVVSIVESSLDAPTIEQLMKADPKITLEEIEDLKIVTFVRGNPGEKPTRYVFPEISHAPASNDLDVFFSRHGALQRLAAAHVALYGNCFIGLYGFLLKAREARLSDALEIEQITQTIRKDDFFRSLSNTMIDSPNAIPSLDREKTIKFLARSADVLGRISALLEKVPSQTADSEYGTCLSAALAHAKLVRSITQKAIEWRMEPWDLEAAKRACPDRWDASPWHFRAGVEALSDGDFEKLVQWFREKNARTMLDSEEWIRGQRLFGRTGYMPDMQMALQWLQQHHYLDVTSDIFGQFEKDFRIAKAAERLSTQNVVVVGYSAPALPIILAMTGRKVIYVDYSQDVLKPFKDAVKEISSSFERERGCGLAMQFVCSDIGLLDPVKERIEPHSIDLITYVDLSPNAKGDIAGWFETPKKLLKKKDGYILIDEQQDPRVERQFESAFPNRQVMFGGEYFSGRFNGIRKDLPEGSTNRFFKVTSDVPAGGVPGADVRMSQAALPTNRQTMKAGAILNGEKSATPAAPPQRAAAAGSEDATMSGAQRLSSAGTETAETGLNSTMRQLLNEAWTLVEEAFANATADLNTRLFAQSVNEHKNADVIINEKIRDEKVGFIFSELATFGDPRDDAEAQGLGIILPELANKGIKVAVLLNIDQKERERQKKLIDELNNKISDRNKWIRCGTSVSEISNEFAGSTARFYYLKTSLETDIDGVIDSISIVVREILRILGKLTGIVQEGQEPDKLYEAAKKFAQAA